MKHHSPPLEEDEASSRKSLDRPPKKPGCTCIIDVARFIRIDFLDDRLEICGNFRPPQSQQAFSDLLRQKDTHSRQPQPSPEVLVLQSHPRAARHSANAGGRHADRAHSSHAFTYLLSLCGRHCTYTPHDLCTPPTCFRFECCARRAERDREGQTGRERQRRKEKETRKREAACARQRVIVRCGEGKGPPSS